MADVSQVIAKPSYTHAAMIDVIVMNPMVSQRDLAAHFGFTESWISQILRSDALRELLAARKAELIDPVVLQGIEKRMEALAMQSLEILQENLQTKRSADVAIKALDLTTRALGFGVKAVGVQINQNFVVAMPQKEVDGESWTRRYQPADRAGANPVPAHIDLDTVIDA